MNKPNKCKRCQWFIKPYWSIINPCDNCYNEENDSIIITTTQKIYTKIIKDQEKAEMEAIKDYCRENNIIPNLIDEKELQLVISLGIEELTKRKNGEWR